MSNYSQCVVSVSETALGGSNRDKDGARREWLVAHMPSYWNPLWRKRHVADMIRHILLTCFFSTPWPGIIESSEFTVMHTD